MYGWFWVITEGEAQPLLPQALQRGPVRGLSVFNLVRLLARQPHPNPDRQKMKRQRQYAGVGLPSSAPPLASAVVRGPFSVVMAPSWPFSSLQSDEHSPRSVFAPDGVGSRGRHERVTYGWNICGRQARRCREWA